MKQGYCLFGLIFMLTACEKKLLENDGDPYTGTWKTDCTASSIVFGQYLPDNNFWFKQKAVITDSTIKLDTIIYADRRCNTLDKNFIPSNSQLTIIHMTKETSSSGDAYRTYFCEDDNKKEQRIDLAYIEDNIYPVSIDIDRFVENNEEDMIVVFDVVYRPYRVESENPSINNSTKNTLRQFLKAIF